MSKNRMIAWAGLISVLIVVIAEFSPGAAQAQNHSRSDRKISSALVPRHSFSLLGKPWVVGAANGAGGVNRSEPPTVFHENNFEIVSVEQGSSGATFLMTARNKITGEAETTTVLMPFVTSDVKWVPTTGEEIHDFIKNKHGGYHPLER